MDFKRIEETDKKVYDLILREKRRQEENIELIASENFVSEAVMEAMGSYLTNKYAEGYPAKRYYGGCQHIDEIESLAISRAKKLFTADHVNVQPHSGSNANMAVYLAMLNYKDIVLGMNLEEGGHLTHGSPVNISGKYFNFVSYGVDEKNEMIDYDDVLKIAKAVKPKMIVAGASAYARKIDFSKFREIADEVGAYLMVDMSHIAGLIAAGLHQNPCQYADVVTTTTHKTLRGPRGAIILCKEEFAKKIDKAVFPGFQGGPLEHIIAAKAVAFGEALKPEFKEYQKKVVENAKVLAERLKEKGARIVSGSTDNHLVLVDTMSLGLTGKEAEHKLDEVKITVNKNTIPGEKNSPMVTSGIRLGSPAITSRGFGVEETKEVADLIIETLTSDVDKESIVRRVLELTSKYPIYR